MSDVIPQAADTGAAEISDDEALGAIWDEASTDDAPAAQRDEAGRFKGTAADEPADADPAADADTDADPDAADPDAPADPNAPPPVAMPANWSGMDEDWKKIPPDVQAKIAARDTELHARMSDQGRQISAFKPIIDVVEQHNDVLAGKIMPNGQPVTMPYAVDFLLKAQRQIDADPVGSLIEIADRYGAREILTGVLTGQIPLPSVPKPTQSAVSAADVQTMVKEALTADQQSRAAEEEVVRLSKDKPLYSQIPEADMVHAIHKARSRLGDAASKDAVFALAYDIAVHADPDLRAKAAAPARAAAPDPKRTEAARRANSVNVTSTSTGRGRKLTLDEELGAAFDAASQKD